MVTDIKINKLDPKDLQKISKIAKWYVNEWNTPIERTFSRLTTQPNQDVLFHLVVTVKNNLIATGGLYNTVNLFREHERFSKYKPWVALLYTAKKYRNQGIGEKLLERIELCAKEIELNEIFLYTFTAESLYKKCGWEEIERVVYKGHDTVIMRKVIKDL